MRPCVGLDWEQSSRTQGQASASSSSRTYLQSLERSSRTWVLSSGKAQASEESSRVESSREEVERGNIWYNPIPEEEEEVLWRRSEQEVVLWRRREEEAVGASGHANLTQPADEIIHVLNDVTQPTDDIANQIDDITAEHIGKC